VCLPMLSCHFAKLRGKKSDIDSIFLRDAENFIFFDICDFSCPESKIKPLGPMLLNGLTKLINEYKEVS